MNHLPETGRIRIRIRKVRIRILIRKVRIWILIRKVRIRIRGSGSVNKIKKLKNCRIRNTTGVFIPQQLVSVLVLALGRKKKRG
jgi:hypothetical protein